MRIGDAAAAAYNPVSAGVAELVDATDLKSVGGNPVPVRFRPPAPSILNHQAVKNFRAPTDDPSLFRPA